ncbi:MAG: hypothetical protein ABFS32_05400 [Bacteroidota bacterium]
MVRVVNYWIIRISLLIGLLFYNQSVFSQISIKDTLSFNREISSASVDRIDNLFLTFADGSITKYNSKLDSVISFSPTKTGQITLMEAWHGFQIFAFYEEFQEFQLLNRFLTQETRYYLPDIIPDYVNLCTISSDQNLWVFNETGFKLIKVNLFTKEVFVEYPLEFLIDENDLQFIFMREYQNKLFLMNKDYTIYIFDNLGNYLNKLETPGITDLCFEDNFLYYLSHEFLYKVHLYNGTSVVKKLPAGNYHQIEIIRSSILIFEGKNALVIERIE